MDLSYEVMGKGGLAFWWIDNAGTVPGTALANYGFNLLPNANRDWASLASGSLLISSSFSLSTGEAFNVTARVITAHALPYDDVGFALLLRNGQTQAVLFAVRPDGVYRVGDMGPNAPNTFHKPSPGVAVTEEIEKAVDVELGGLKYWPHDAGGASSSTKMVSTYTPGAGVYQLLAGVFTLSQSANQDRPSALVLECVRLP
jgi:hypothetical protein